MFSVIKRVRLNNVMRRFSNLNNTNTNDAYILYNSVRVKFPSIYWSGTIDSKNIFNNIRDNDSEIKYFVIKSTIESYKLEQKRSLSILNDKIALSRSNHGLNDTIFLEDIQQNTFFNKKLNMWNITDLLRKYKINADDLYASLAYVSDDRCPHNINLTYKHFCDEFKKLSKDKMNDGYINLSYYNDDSRYFTKFPLDTTKYESNIILRRYDAGDVIGRITRLLAIKGYD